MSVIESCFGQPRGIIQTSAGPVEIATLGDGPPVLSVHGGPGGCDQGLLMALPFFRNGFRVIAPSRPGYLGTPLSSGTTFAEQADLLAALLDALNLPSIAVFGASAGGPPTYLLAQRHPERVSALLVVAGVTRRYTKAAELSAAERAIFLSRPGAWFMNWLGHAFPRSVVANLLKTESTLSPEAIEQRVQEVVADPEKLAFVQALLRTMSADFANRQSGLENDLHQLEAIGRLDLSAIRCPTMIMHGEADGDVPPDDARWAHEQIIESHLHWIPQGSHLGFWIAPESAQAQQIASEFLRR